MTRKVLAFGYIPKGKGGKQTTGLATGIFNLHNAENELTTDYQVVIAATDIHQWEVMIDNTKVIGWDKKSLIKHSIKHPLRIAFFVIKCLQVFRFWRVFPPSLMLAKLIFLDYSIDRENPDIVHFHGSSGALLSMGLWGKNIKKILRLHGINGFNKSIRNFQIQQKIEMFITELAFERVTFNALFTSKEWKEAYGAFSCESIVVHNGYNSKLFYPHKSPTLKNKKFDLITFSGISENKGQKRVLEALVKLESEGLVLSYLIIGSGSKKQLNQLNNIIATNNLAVEIINYLPQHELNTYLHQSKFFILPSITEGFGQVFIESIGAGVPVIIPKHLPLAKEHGILNETNSILIEDYTTESITEGLKQIFSQHKECDPHLVSKTVEHLDWLKIAGQYVDIYEGLDS